MFACQLYRGASAAHAVGSTQIPGLTALTSIIHAVQLAFNPLATEDAVA